MKKVFLLYKSLGKYNDHLVAVYETKALAIKARYVAERLTHGEIDFYIVEKYVIGE